MNKKKIIEHWKKKLKIKNEEKPWQQSKAEIFIPELISFSVPQ